MKWVCDICGYVHDEEEPPDGCPVCGAPKRKFSEWTGDEEDGLGEDFEHDDDPDDDDEGDRY